MGYSEPVFIIDMNGRASVRYPSGRSVSVEELRKKQMRLQEAAINRWWSPRHDRVLLRWVEQFGYAWQGRVGELRGELARCSPKSFARWTEWVDKKREKSLGTYVAIWQNQLLFHARRRVNSLGYLEEFERSKVDRCRCCRKLFEKSLQPHHKLVLIGQVGLPVCKKCLRRSLFSLGTDLSSREIKTYLRKLTSIVGGVPRSGFGDYPRHYIGLSVDQIVALSKLLRKRPISESVRIEFGSWPQALLAAGIDITLNSGRGRRCVAKDGHVCLSLAEKTLDDFLFANQIPHEKEVHYPESRLRCDFFVGDVYIEYFGLRGDVEYDKKTQRKLLLAKAANLKLLPLFAEDIVDVSVLRRKLTLAGIFTQSRLDLAFGPNTPGGAGAD